MNTTTAPSIVIVPGLRGHVEDHWQTHLAARLENVRTVPPVEDEPLGRAARVAALAATVAAVQGPVVLVAHSAGVLTTVHWAVQAGSAGRVLGALLMTPADMEAALPEPHPSRAQLEAGGWLPVPRRRLPFPTLLGVSDDDPLCTRRRALGMAEVWGSRPVELGGVGHLNPAAGYGDWPRADALLAGLLDEVARRAAAV